MRLSDGSAFKRWIARAHSPWLIWFIMLCECHEEILMPVAAVTSVGSRKPLHAPGMVLGSYSAKLGFSKSPIKQNVRHLINVLVFGKENHPIRNATLKQVLKIVHSLKPTRLFKVQWVKIDLANPPHWSKPIHGHKLGMIIYHCRLCRFPVELG